MMMRRSPARLRTLWLVLMVGLAATLVAAELIGDAGDAGRWTERITSHPMFLALLGVAVIVIAMTTARRVGLERRHLLHPRRPSVDRGIPVVGPDEVSRALRLPMWWRAPAAEPGDLRFVREPWGRWSGIALHLGIMITVCAGAMIAATSRSGVLVLAEGGVVPKGMELASVEAGPFAPPLVLPDSIELLAVRPAWWASGELRDVQTEALLGPNRVPFTVGVNMVNRWEDLRLFQTTTFGRAFLLELTDSAGESIQVRVELTAPLKLGEYSYRDITVEGIEPTLRLKYTEVLQSGQPVPELTMRLEDNGEVTAQGIVSESFPVALGSYTVEYLGDVYWEQLYVTGQSGAGLLVAGLIMICLGAIGLYSTRPAEVYLVETDGSWKATILVGGRALPTEHDEIAHLLA